MVIIFFKIIGIIQLLIFCCFLSSDAFSQHLVINEIQSSNSSTISDSFNEYEDWIELYNGTDTVVNLTNYTLSDDFTNPDKWVFPFLNINPGEFLIVFASGNNIYDGNYWHTNFSINKQGENIVLSNPQGVIIDYFFSISIPTDHSFGRLPDGSAEFTYFYNPTPELPNGGQTYSELLEPVIFSHTGGFYTESFNLELSHPNPDATIVYTLDGSEPDINNLDGSSYLYKNEYAYSPEDDFGDFLESHYYSFLYVEPIPIIDISNKEDYLTQFSSTFQPSSYFPLSPVKKAKVVRAKAFKDNAVSDFTVTNTFFINENGREEFDLPIVSLAMNSKGLFDYEKGNYTAGVDADNWRENNPNAQPQEPFVANFQRRGESVEVPANFEFFDKNSTFSDISQGTGLRIHGGYYTRAHPQKSFRVYARSRYGTSELNYTFFENYNFSSFKRLLLRNSGNDYWRTMFRDAAIQKVMYDMNMKTQEYTPASVFINGEYWGILNIRERFDKYYFKRVFDVEINDLDYLSNWEAKEGCLTHWHNTQSYIVNNDITDNEHYEFIKTRIDIDNFIDYYIANIYANNFDWPHNNNDRFRKRTEHYEPDAPYGQDGRWRWLLYDTDFGFDFFEDSTAYKNNMMEHATNPELGNFGTFLFRNLLKNEEFEQEFLDRFEYHLLNTFNPERVENIIDSLAVGIENEILDHSHRWRRGTVTFNRWIGFVNVMVDFAYQRPCAMRDILMDFFEIQDSTYAFGVCEYNNIDYPEDEPPEDFVYDDDISLFPVPVDDFLIVSFKNTKLLFEYISIYDMTGKEVKRVNISQSYHTEEIIIDCADLNAGNYCLVITTKSEVIVKNFIIIR